jgi:hypothetical protein
MKIESQAAAGSGVVVVGRSFMDRGYGLEMLDPNLHSGIILPTTSATAVAGNIKFYSEVFFKNNIFNS